MTRNNLVQEPERYEHEPLAFVTRGANSANLVAGVNNKVTFDQYPINEMGAFDVANQWYVCPRAGRLKTETSVAFYSGTSGSNIIQLVLFVDDSAGAGIARFVIYQAGQLPNDTYYVINGNKSFPVDVGTRVYLEMFTQGNGSFFVGNTSYMYNTFCCHYMP